MTDTLTLTDGTAALTLVPQLGLQTPRYHFHVGRVVHAARELGLFRVQTTLLLGNDLTGESELAGVTPALPPEALARLVAAAQQRAAAEPAAFGAWLIVELPGWRDDAGHSPFWQALGGRFYRGDPLEAEQRLGADWRSHLAALLPRQSVYLSFLGEAAERRLGAVLPAAQPALEVLTAAGFERAAQVRIDDGGPVLAWRVPQAPPRC